MDIRVGKFDLHATAGATPTLTLTWVDEAGADYSLVGSAVSLWVGGTVTDPTDFTDATEYVGVIATNTATITPTIPQGSSTPLRLTLDAELVAIGTLTPSAVGSASADLDVTVNVDPLAFTVTFAEGRALADVFGRWTDLGNLGATETISGSLFTQVRRTGQLSQACAVTIDLADDEQIDLIVTQPNAGGMAVTFTGVDSWTTSDEQVPDLTGRGSYDLDRFYFEAVEGVTYGYWYTEPRTTVTIGVCVGVALSDEVTAITTGAAKVSIRSPYAFTLTSVRASLTEASSSGVPTVDINEGGVSVLSTKLTIDANELTSTTAATAAVISDAAIADDALLTFDIDVAGTNAKGLKVWLYGTREA